MCRHLAPQRHHAAIGAPTGLGSRAHARDLCGPEVDARSCAHCEPMRLGGEDLLARVGVKHSVPFVGRSRLWRVRKGL